MKIAVCDDEAIAREEILSLVEDYVSAKNTALSAEAFADYSELEGREDEFDIFLVDYMMQGLDGLSFAHSLREKYGGRKVIIFITQFSEIVYDTFAVQAHRFLKKPVEKEKLFEALDSFLDSGGSSGSMIIRYNGTVTAVRLEDIYYLEISHKELYVCTEKEQILCRRSITSVEEELSELGFFRVHRNYIVNMKNIRSFNNTGIELLNGEKIPLSTRKQHEFCKAYLKMN